jgi:hypothetical protein
VPHPRHDAFIADPTHRRPITPLGLQLFSKKFNKICKEQGSASSLLGDFFDVDFEILTWDYVPEEKYRVLLAGQTKEYIDDYISERNNIVSEIHIKLVVNKE